MCGIAGIWPTERLRYPAEWLPIMLDRIRHRGPDGEGVWADPVHRVLLGHRRLAVIDLSAAGDQPMLSSDGQLALVFNGEIYNYRELRAELTARGVSFRSQSDSEVLLQGYAHWGVGVLDRLAGMFAFALWDAAQGRLFLARDRAGEKPLYYAQTPEGFAFASEVQALAGLPWVDRGLDPDALALYLHYQYVPAPYSIYRGIRKLPPAHAMLVEGERVTQWRYWDPSALAVGPRLALTEAEATERLEVLLRQSITGQMIADVPLGAFLSGGIDSSLVVSLMTELASGQVKTYTIGFAVPGYDEAEHAGAVAKHLGTEHTVEYLTEQDALALVPRVPGLYGEPFADSSALPTHLVSCVARKHVTVSLSGDGGDEAFGGYTRYALLERYEPWLRLMGPLRGVVQPVARLLPGRLARAAQLLGQPAAELYRGLVSTFLGAEVEALCGRKHTLTEYDRAWAAGSNQPLRRHAMLADLLTYMPEAILVKVDRAAMAVALETRAPLLDHRVLEFSLQLPLPLVREKRLLKQLLFQRVPRALLDRPKQGFAVPLERWLRGPLRDLLTDALTPGRLQGLGVANTALVDQLLKEHLSGARNHAARLWALLVLSMWGEARA